MDYKQKLSVYLAQEWSLDIELITSLLETPPQEDMGDFAFPCFRLAKELRKAPQKIAEEFAGKLQNLPPFLAECKQLGAYVNFFLDKQNFCKTCIEEVFQQGAGLFQTKQGEDKTVLIEYSSPNIAKPFHVGHAFTTFLGDVLARMYESLGYKVERLNHLGDYGTQFGKLIVAFEKWGDREALQEDAIKELLRIYVKFHKEVHENPSLDDEARARFKALEDGKSPEVDLWKEFRDLSLEEFNRIYERIDVHFDSYNGESFYSDLIPAMVNDLEEKSLLVESQGAKVVMLDEENLPPCLVLKSDGSTIYATRDLTAAKYRFDRYGFYKSIYVVGLPQSLHFKQVFSILKKAGYTWVEDCVHVGFGLVKFPDNVLFSTRNGDVIYLEDLLDEAIKKTKAIIIENNEGREDKISDTEIEETAKTLGLAAVRYMFLKSGRERDIVFRWEDILDFEGDSAPYMLYAYARAKSILRKSATPDDVLRSYEITKVGSDAEFQLCREISAIAGALQGAVEVNEPSVLARQLMNVCRSFNRFYNQMPILQAEEEEKMGRLALTLAFSESLKYALDLLGIKTVERM